MPDSPDWSAWISRDWFSWRKTFEGEEATVLQVRILKNCWMRELVENRLWSSLDARRRCRDPPHKIISITRITSDPIFAMPKPRPRHLGLQVRGIHRLEVVCLGELRGKEGVRVRWIKGLLTGKSVESVPCEERCDDAAKPWCKCAVQAHDGIIDCDIGAV